jgi:hypothetical protein
MTPQPTTATNANANANANANYTDKRTGIVYTDVRATRNETQRVALQKTPHLDAFISDAFLKSYFGGVGK